MVLSSKHVRMVGPVVVPQTRQLLVGLVADAAAEGLPSDVGHQVPLQHGGGAEDLPACGAGVVLLGVHLVDVLAVVLQRGEAHPALLAVVGIFYVMKGVQVDREAVGLPEALATIPADIWLIPSVGPHVAGQLNGLGKHSVAVLACVHFSFRVLLLGVVGQRRGLGEGHEAVLAHERTVPGVKAKVVLQSRIGGKLCPTLFTGERLLIKMLRQFVVLHA